MAAKPKCYNRRKVDVDLTCVKVALAELKTDMRNVIKLEESCRKARNDLFSRARVIESDINILKTKQKIVTWIGSIFTITGITALVKYLFNHIK